MAVLLAGRSAYSWVVQLVHVTAAESVAWKGCSLAESMVVPRVGGMVDEKVRLLVEWTAVKRVVLTAGKSAI